MAKSKGPSAGGAGQGKGRRRGSPPLSEGYNPVGTPPFGGSPYNPDSAITAVMEGMSSPASGMFSVEQDILQGLIGVLSEAERLLQELESRIGLGLRSSLTTPILATTSVHGNVQDQLRQNMLMAAERAASAVGQPILLPSGQGVRPNPQIAPSPPAPAEIGGLPLGSGRSPLSGGAYPSAVPNLGVEGTPIPAGRYPINPIDIQQNVFGGASVKGSTFINEHPGQQPGTVGIPTPTPTGPDIPISNDQGDCTQEELSQFINNPPPGYSVCPPYLPRTGDPCACLKLSQQGYDAAGCMASIGEWCYTGSGQQPGPPGPTVPVPTPAPTPTPTPPTGPDCPQTCPPGPPGPPGPQGPPGPPGPPVTPPPIDCPPGYEPVWNGKYYTCEKKVQPPPPIEPIPPTPLPPPEPPPPPIGQPPPKPCGTSRDNPCFVASSSIDAAHPHFLASRGEIDDIQKAGNLTIRLDAGAMQGFAMGLGITDNADDMIDCDIPYMASVVSDGTGIGEMLSQGLTLSDIFNTNLTNVKRSEGMFRVSVLGVFFTIVDASAKLWGTLIDKCLNVVGGANATLASIAQSEVLFGILNFVCMGKLRKHQYIVEASNNVRYPVRLPSPAEAGSAWLAAEINDCTFRTYVTAGDYRFEPYTAIVRAGKFKFSALEIMTLNMRDAFKRGDIFTRLREVGSLHKEDVEELTSLMVALPGPADVVRFMQRDTADPDIVDTFGLDADFEAKYRGQVAEWGRAQGLTDDVMRNFWRAHWDIPSPTQLYLMLHRLRHNPDYGTEGTIEDDVRKALEQQDILPYWIDRLMAVSYNPLTRTDLLRAYERGWIDDEQYLNGIYQDGYSDKDAQTLLQFAQQERKYALRHLDIVHQYREGYMSQDQLREMLLSEGYAEKVVPDAVSIASDLRQIEQQAAVIKNLNKQFRACRMDAAEYESAASDAGVPSELIMYQLGIQRWYTACGSRRESIGALCQSLDQGLVTPQEYLDRAKEMKFDTDAAERYLTLCQNKSRANEAKKAAQAARAEAQANAKASKEAEAAQRRAERQAEKLAAMAEKMERARQTRNRMLEDATAKLEPLLTDPGADAAVVVDTVYSLLMAKFGLTQNEAANAVNLSATKFPGGSADGFTDFAADVGRSALADPFVLYPYLSANGKPH